MKVCFKCGVAKPLTDYYAHPQTRDGHLGKCKTCTRQNVQANRREHVLYYRAYDRSRAKTKERKQYVNDASRRHRQKEPTKYSARTAVGNALRDGRLVRGTCEVCGVADVEAHHDDYGQPLNVRWLCFACHRREHGQHVET